MRTLTCAPEIEIIGQTVSSFVENVNGDEIIPLLQQHGLYPIDPQAWYPTQKWLDILNELSQDKNFSASYIAIGMSIVQTMLLPPEMVTLPLSAILMGWNDLYQMQHRNGDIGSVETVRISDTHYRTIHRHLYPDDFTYGIAYGMARRWLPVGTPFTVKYDDTTPRMDLGGDKTIIDVKWG